MFFQQLTPEYLSENLPDVHSGLQHNHHSKKTRSTDSITNHYRNILPAALCYLIDYQLISKLPKKNIIRRAYNLYYNNNIEPHPSYDQCAVLHAVRSFDGGPAEGYYEIKGPGWITLFDAGDGYNEGWNGFDYDPNGLHTYKNEDRNTFDEESIATEIEELMKHNPYDRNP